MCTKKKKRKKKNTHTHKMDDENSTKDSPSFNITKPTTTKTPPQSKMSPCLSRLPPNSLSLLNLCLTRRRARLSSEASSTLASPPPSSSSLLFEGNESRGNDEFVVRRYNRRRYSLHEDEGDDDDEGLGGEAEREETGSAGGGFKFSLFYLIALLSILTIAAIKQRTSLGNDFFLNVDARGAKLINEYRKGDEVDGSSSRDGEVKRDAEAGSEGGEILNVKENGNFPQGDDSLDFHGESDGLNTAAKVDEDVFEGSSPDVVGEEEGAATVGKGENEKLTVKEVGGYKGQEEAGGKEYDYDHGRDNDASEREGEGKVREEGSRGENSEGKTSTPEGEGGEIYGQVDEDGIDVGRDEIEAHDRVEGAIVEVPAIVAAATESIAANDENFEVDGMPGGTEGEDPREAIRGRRGGSEGDTKEAEQERPKEDFANDVEVASEGDTKEAEQERPEEDFANDEEAASETTDVAIADGAESAAEEVNDAIDGDAEEDHGASNHVDEAREVRSNAGGDNERGNPPEETSGIVPDPDDEHQAFAADVAAENAEKMKEIETLPTETDSAGAGKNVSASDRGALLDAFEGPDDAIERVGQVENDELTGSDIAAALVHLALHKLSSEGNSALKSFVSSGGKRGAELEAERAKYEAKFDHARIRAGAVVLRNMTSPAEIQKSPLHRRVMSYLGLFFHAHPPEFVLTPYVSGLSELVPGSFCFAASDSNFTVSFSSPIPISSVGLEVTAENFMNAPKQFGIVGHNFARRGDKAGYDLGSFTFPASPDLLVRDEGGNGTRGRKEGSALFGEKKTKSRSVLYSEFKLQYDEHEAVPPLSSLTIQVEQTQGGPKSSLCLQRIRAFSDAEKH